MTRTEKSYFRQWKSSILAELARTECEADAVESKYMRINGYGACSPENFILQIATTTEVSEKERIQDIQAVIANMCARAKRYAAIDTLPI